MQAHCLLLITAYYLSSFKFACGTTLLYTRGPHNLNQGLKHHMPSNYDCNLFFFLIHNYLWFSMAL